MKRKGKFRALAALLLALMMVAGTAGVAGADLGSCTDSTSCNSCDYRQFPCCGPDVVNVTCIHSHGEIQYYSYCAYVCSPQP
jgi:hypothetical protein